jgi:uncharacterized protein (DUF1697 family)
VSVVVALLRGINLGPKRRVAMADLRALLEEAGFENVRTHLQSGNVVLETDAAPDEAARTIEERIAERVGFDVDVIVRTAPELADVAANSPFADVETDGSRHHVVFLPSEPDADALAELAEQDFEPDRYAARGREIYAWCPNGMRDSHLMRALADPRLAPTGTVRNWNTVTKLLALARPD